MDARQVDQEWENEIRRQRAEQMRAIRKQREINTKKKVGNLLDSLYSL